MKGSLVLLFVALTSVVLAEEGYITKYDNIDLDQILKSERLLNNYTNCLLDLGKCTPDGSELRRNLPDALKNNCSKCSEKQKKGSEKVIRFLLEQKPKVFAKLEAKYDPNGVYRKQYESEAKRLDLPI